jgi:hypothetical protein
MDDWGIAADLLYYQKYNEEYQKMNTKIHGLQLDASTVEQDHALCEQHLKALRCTEGLAHLKGLGPTVSLPMPSGIHTSLMMKIMMMNGPLPSSIDMGIDSEEEVMKWPSGPSHGG